MQALTFTDLEPHESQMCFLLPDHSPLAAAVRICRVQCPCLVLSKATDTPEDRNNPVLLYNKLALGDLNANFTLEIESKVKKKLFVSSLLFTFLLFSYDYLSHLKVFNWSYFTAKIMGTVNISVPDTEKVINYSPNYYRRLNLVLARYTKRCVSTCL